MRPGPQIKFPPSLRQQQILVTAQQKKGGIALSALSIAEDATNGTAIGTLSVPGGSGVYTFTIAEDPDDLFAISGGDLDKSGTLDYEVATTHRVRIKADNGIDAPVFTWFTITVTNVAPVLSNATDTKTGQTTATITVDTTESNGTLYWVVTTSSTPPTAAQIIAGKDNSGVTATASGTQAISTTGTKTVSVTGLTASTAYTAHFVHKEGTPGFLNSNVTSGDGFTTDSPGITGLLDVLGVSAVRAYSTRKLLNAYAGSAIRVRESGGNTEQDIGFSGENLDTAALATFVGANSGFITKWYDQSGNGDDLVQATTGAQPRIVNSGTIDTRNSLPCAKFDGTNDTLLASVSVAGAEIGAVLAVVDAANFGNWYGAVCNNAGAGGGMQGLGGGNTKWYDGGTFDTFSVNNGGNTVVFNGVLSQNDGYSAASSITFNTLCLGDAAAGGVYWPGWIGEAVLYATKLSAGNRTAQYNNQKAYWGTP